MGDEQETQQYEVTVSVTAVVYVEAIDEEQAAELAFDQWRDGNIDDVSVLEVSEV
jgi:hypothetical protein